MKLKGKILALSLVPVILLGVTMFLVAADRIANGIYDEAYLGMHATALAVCDVFEIGYEGQYHLDENGAFGNHVRRQSQYFRRVRDSGATMSLRNRIS